MSRIVQAWSLPAQLPILAADDVHVWHVSLASSGTSVGQLNHLLSPAERARADRFHFKMDCERFTVGRACLRIILGRYLQTDPAVIEFTYGKYGKPQLTTATDELGQFKFNLAHSHNSALYAFTLGREIGIDIERISPEFAREEIAERFFSASEVELLSRVPSQMRPEAFFTCWTRKEAFVKAKGIGLSLPLDQFDVTLSPLAPAELLRTHWDESEALRWSLQTIDLGPDYAGAIAVEGHDWRLKCWQPEDEFFTEGVCTIVQQLQ